MSATLNEQISIGNALVPPEGPVVMPALLDFSTAGAVLVDFTLAQMQKRITAIQTVVVRNFQNPNALSIIVDGTGQVIDVPALSDAVLPVLAARLPKFKCVTVSGPQIQTLWLNVPLPSVIVYASGGQSVTVTGTVDVSGSSVYVSPLAATASAGAAHSIATGGTAQNAFLGITTGAFITNPLNATESLFVDMVNVAGTVAPGTHGTTVELVPGQSQAFPALVTSISVNAVTSGHVFTAVQW
jgi:hypothetical protein